MIQRRVVGLNRELMTGNSTYCIDVCLLDLYECVKV